MKLWTDPVWSKVIASGITAGLGIVLAYYIGRLQTVPPQIQVSGSSNPLSNVLFLGDKLHFGLKNVDAETEKVLWIVDEENMIEDRHERKTEYIFLPEKREHRIDAFFKIKGRYESASVRIELEDPMEVAKRIPKFYSSVSLPPNAALKPEAP